MLRANDLGRGPVWLVPWLLPVWAPAPADFQRRVSQGAGPGKEMGMRPRKPCNKPGCPTLVPAGQRYCRADRQQQAREYNQNQRPARHAFYQTPEWRALSKQVLAEEPWCYCGARATQADHILSLKERPDLGLVRSNLVGRCGPCHSLRTAREHGRWG